MWPPSLNASSVGRYEILCRLAQGGMAQLFLARARGIEGFEKIVVLKRIRPEYAESERFISMFLDEARLAAQLHHPNVVQVYDIGMAGSDYFFTMEYVHGRDVRDVLRVVSERPQGRLAIGDALAIVIDAAKGLHYAHELRDAQGQALGIVHRDVSPSNVLVTFDGAVKIVDFGIAKAATASSETRSGGLKGKIPYMSPEQCQGHALDRRSDLFALGALLHELVTGVRLFRGDTDFAIMEQIVRAEPQRHVRGIRDLPVELDDIIRRCVARDLNQRVSTAQELQLALERLAREHRIEISSVSVSRMMHDLYGAEARASEQAVREGRSLAELQLATLTGAPADARHGDARHGDAPSEPLVAASDGGSWRTLDGPVPTPRRARYAIAIGAAAIGLGLFALAWSLWPRSSPPTSTAIVAPPSAPARALAPEIVPAQLPSPALAPPSPALVSPSPTPSPLADRGRVKRKRGAASSTPTKRAAARAARETPSWTLDSNALPPADQPLGVSR